MQGNAPALPHAARSSRVSPNASGAQQQTPSASAIITGQSDAMTELLGIIGGSVFGVFGITVGALATTVPSVRRKIMPNRNRGAKLRENLRNPNNKVQNVEDEVKNNAKDAETEATTNGDTALESNAGDISVTVDQEDALVELEEIGSIDGEELADSSSGGPIGLAIGIAIVVNNHHRLDHHR